MLEEICDPNQEFFDEKNNGVAESSNTSGCCEDRSPVWILESFFGPRLHVVIQNCAMAVYRNGNREFVVRFPCDVMPIKYRMPFLFTLTSRADHWISPRDESRRSRFATIAFAIRSNAPFGHDFGAVLFQLDQVMEVSWALGGTPV